MVPAVLFDFGGTLDSDGVHTLDRFYAIYDALGPEAPSRPRVKEAFYAADALIEHDPAVESWTLGTLVRRLVAAQFDVLGLADRALEERVARAFLDPCEVMLGRNRPILASLRARGFRLGIVSNFYGNLQAICDEFGLAGEIDVALDSAVVGLSKPDPRFFTLALERLGAAPGDAVFVGDSLERDLRPAKGVGMRTIWLRDNLEGSCNEPGLPDLTISSLSELPRALSAWWPGSDR
jgi:HAD superfamily hydrolase (TIGR01509 family)